jgi:hypothetical protein
MEWESLLSDTNDIDQNWNKFNEIIKKLGRNPLDFT